MLQGKVHDHTIIISIQENHYSHQATAPTKPNIDISTPTARPPFSLVGVAAAADDVAETVTIAVAVWRAVPEVRLVVERFPLYV